MFRLTRNNTLCKLVSQNVCPKRLSSAARVNTVLVFVPQQEAWLVERFGKFAKVMNPGLNFIYPVIDKIKYVQVLKEIPIQVPDQAAITLDNVLLHLDGVLYVKVLDPYKASYGVEDVEFAITQLAQTTMRSEIGKITLDEIFRERENLNEAIVAALNKAADDWGITCLRYEIRDITLPSKIQDAMQMMVEAERRKRAAILDSEGVKQSEINVAEGQKQATILRSEAFKTEQVNQALGEAEAILAKAQAKSKSVQIVASALSEKNGMNAVSYTVAEQYVSAFGNLAKKGNTVILPSNTGDVSNMVAQAMSIYKNLSHVDQKTPSEELDDSPPSISLSGEEVLDDQEPVYSFDKDTDDKKS